MTQNMPLKIQPNGTELKYMPGNDVTFVDYMSRGTPGDCISLNLHHFRIQYCILCMDK